ncbi:MAG TPA: CvpA family protein [Candidatus Limnocylindria bacterium]|nr:CvpA family protein [Candidatus Limnocylindria bacterium]
MFIWLLLLVLVGGFAAIGFQTGSIRASVSLIGVIAGVLLAPVLGGLLAPAFHSASVIWQQALPPVIAFLVVWLIFFGLGFAAHKPVELHFKYKEDDATRSSFERMNKALGLFVGLLAGVIVFLNVGQPIYAKGYITTQMAGEAGEPSPVSYLNSLRTDMSQSGWDKTFAALDHTTAQEYAIADILGLIHANPLIEGRVQTYPPFLALAERSEFTDIGADADYQKLLQDRAGFTALYTNPKTQGILKNDELTQQLLKTDLHDFRTYLETGKSPKFDDEKILGHWRTDVNSIITDARRKRTTLTPLELKSLRFALNTLLKQATLTAYTDGRYVVKVPPPAAVAAPVAAAAAPPVVDPLAARYGRRSGGGAPQVAQAAPAPQDPMAPAKKLFAGRSLNELSVEGSWVRSADKYILTSKQNGKDDVQEASITDAGRLVIPVPELKLTLFFVRVI